MLLRYNYDYASDITWRFDDKMQTAHAKNWSQKYTYDTLVRLTQAEQGSIGGTWPGSPSMTADHTWTWDSAGDPTLDKLGNWEQFDNNGTDDVRQHNAANEIQSRTYGGQEADAGETAGLRADEDEEAPRSVFWRVPAKAGELGEGTLKTGIALQALGNLNIRKAFRWSRRSELNRQPELYESSALPLSHAG